MRLSGPRKKSRRLEKTVHRCFQTFAAYQKRTERVVHFLVGVFFRKAAHFSSPII